MGLRPTFVFWAFLLCVALWQSTSKRVVVPEHKAVIVEIPVNKVPARVAPPYKAPPNKFDLSEYSQNTEFFLGSPQDDVEIMFDRSERSGRFDSEGKLIFPRDPRNMN